MKGLAIHAVLALAGLLFAYQTWTRPAVVEERPVDQAIVLQCKPEQLERLELDMATHNVQLVPVVSGKDRSYWLTSSPSAKKLKELAEQDADAGTASSEPELKGVKKLDATAPVTYRGSAAVDALLAELLPLRALRDLGQLDKARDAEFGFDKATTTFKMSCGGQSIALTIAGRTYGNNDSYARDQKSGKTYLLPGKPFVDLQAAQFKLMQNELHSFALADVDEAVITVGDTTRKLLQRDRAIPGQAQWVDADKPDQRNEAFGNWLGRVAKMRVRKYLPRGADPGAELSDPHGPPERVMTIEYKLEGKPKGRAEVVRIASEGGAQFYYGRSETSEVWAALFDTLVKEIETDLPLVVGAAATSTEPATPATPATPAAPQK
jgi:hypothetical protein